MKSWYVTLGKLRMELRCGGRDEFVLVLLQDAGAFASNELEIAVGDTVWGVMERQV